MKINHNGSTKKTLNMKLLLQLTVVFIINYKIIAQNISSGNFHNLAICLDSTVNGWGINTYYQIDSSWAQGLDPRKISGPGGPLRNVIQVSAGSNFSLFLKNDGSVWGMGSNVNKEMGLLSGYYAIAPTKIYGLSDIVSIAAGRYHCLALKNDGTVWLWGGYGYDYSPYQVKGLSNVISMDAGLEHSYAIKNDGTLWTWTLDSTIAPSLVVGLSDVKQVSANGWVSDRTLVLKTDGTVWSWGDNQFGQVGNGTNVYVNSPVQIMSLNNVIAVAAGVRHSVALKNDGSIWSWGRNYQGQLGDGTYVDRNSPSLAINVPANVINIDAGDAHTIALTSAGLVYACGDGIHHQKGPYLGFPETTFSQQVTTLCEVKTSTPTTNFKKNPLSQNKLSLFPNPNRGVFRISLNKNSNISGEIYIYNSLGYIVFYTKIDGTSENEIELNLKDSSSGLYSYRLISEGVELANDKFIIE